MAMDRRGFLKTVGGTAIALAAGIPASGRQKPSQPDEAVVGQAEDRIRKCRVGTAALRFIGPDGQPLPAGVNLRISQTKHKFLFGCNIFKLGLCRTAENNAGYEKQVAEFYTVLFSHPAVEAVTWWDFTDQNAWQQAPAGLVRDDMTPKPAYEQLRSLVKGKWWTKVEAATDAQGNLGFQGFLGQYEVEAKLGGRRLAGGFSLDRDHKATVEIRLA